MKRILLIGLVLFLTLGMVVFAGGRRGAEDRLNFATGGVAGTYFPFGTAIGQVVGEHTGLQIIIQSTGASRSNIQLIEAGEVELAIVQNDVMYYAWTGGDFFQGDRFRSFNAVAALYPEPVQIIAAAGVGISSVADFRGRSISIGDVGSGVEFNARQVLEAYGIGLHEITVQNLGFAASADAMRDGRIDAFFATSGVPIPGVVDLATTRDIILVPIGGPQAERLMRDHPFYTVFYIPAGSYRGMTAPVRTLTVKATLIARADVPEETMYRFTRALFENQPQLAIAHFRGHDLKFPDAIEGIGIVPFHPGALRFFRSIGVK